MSFYGDLLRDYEKRYTKGFYGGLPVYLKFKTSPSEKTTLAQTYRISRSVETNQDVQTTSYNAANGATLKSTCSGKEVATKLKFGNGGATYEVAYKPSAYNTPDQTVNVKHVSRFDSSSSRIDSTESVKYGSPAVGPIRLWLTADLAWNNQNQNRAVKGSANIKKDDLNVGAKVDFDLTKNALKTLHAMALYSHVKGDFFIVGDLLKKQITFGSHYPVYKIGNHAVEIVYDTQGKLKGAFGQPAIVNWAGEYRVTDNANAKVKFSISQQWTLGFAWIHKFDKNLKLGFSHDLNVTELNSGKGSPYNFGASLQWTL